MIIFECPSCKKKLQAAEQHVGKAIRCPHCQAVASVPAAAEEIATAVTSAPNPAPPPPAPPATAVTTPEVAKTTQARDDDESDGKVLKARRKRVDDDDDDDRPSKRRRDHEPASPVKAGIGVGMILLILGGVAACCVVPILVALLVPAVQKVREAAARTQSMNNMKNIALGFHAYHDVHMQLPFNGTQVANVNVPQSGSWAYHILPHIEQDAVFRRVDRSVPVMTYMCPGRGRPGVEAGGGAWSDYFYNNYFNDPDNASMPNAPNKKRSLVGVTDGTSNTIIVGHGNVSLNQYQQSAGVAFSTNIFDGGKAGTMRSGNNGNNNPLGWTLMRDTMGNPGQGSWGGPFSQGALMAMGDGTVRLFPYNTQNFGVFLTPTGGEAALIP